MKRGAIPEESGSGLEKFVVDRQSDGTWFAQGWRYATEWANGVGSNGAAVGPTPVDAVIAAVFNYHERQKLRDR